MPLKLTMTEGFDLHPSGEWIPGTLIAIEEYEGQYDGPALKWIFQLDEEENEEWQFSSQKLSPKSKLYKWLQGLDPANLPEAGQIVDFEKYVGTRIEVMYEHEKKNGLMEERVEKLRAEKKQAAIKGQQKEAANAKKPGTQRPGATYVVPDDESPF